MFGNIASDVLLLSRPGPWGPVHMVGITSAPVEQVSCEGCAVFHPADAAPISGTAQTVSPSYGFVGLDGYSTYREGSRPVRFIYVGDTARRTGSAQDMIAHMLLEADHRRVDDLVIPSVGVHFGEGCAPEVSAQILFETLYGYWRANPMRGPHNVLFVLDDAEVFASAYTDMLQRVFGDSVVAEMTHGSNSGEEEESVLQFVEGLGDPNRVRQSLTTLRLALAENPLLARGRVMRELFRIVKDAPTLAIQPGTIVDRNSIGYYAEAMSILRTLAEQEGAAALEASACLAQIGYKRRKVRRAN